LKREIDLETCSEVTVSDRVLGTEGMDKWEPGGCFCSRAFRVSIVKLDKVSDEDNTLIAPRISPSETFRTTHFTGQLSSFVDFSGRFVEDGARHGGGFMSLVRQDSKLMRSLFDKDVSKGQSIFELRTRCEKKMSLDHAETLLSEAQSLRMEVSSSATIRRTARGTPKTMRDDFRSDWRTEIRSDSGSDCF